MRIDLHALPVITYWRQHDGARLARGDVHLWKLHHSAAAASAEEHQLLDDAEQARAKRLLRPTDRAFFIKTHAAVRRILGRYLEQPPQRLRFRYGAQGKPSLDMPSGRLSFNLSHSGDLALLALTSGSPIGIDIEAVRSGKDLLQIAKRLFSAEQQAHLSSLRENQRDRLFFYYWTQFEARLKARGEGLFGTSQTSPHELRCQSFIPAADYLASLAMIDADSPIADWKTYLYSG